MPSQRTKSKDDTWTTAELGRALKSDDRRRTRDRDEDRKRDRINGEDRHRRKREEDSEKRRHRDDEDGERRRHHHDDERRSKHREEDPRRGELTEDERERQRRERRERREKTDGRDSKKEIPYRSKGEERQPRDFEEVEEDDRHVRRRNGEERERRRGEEDREKRRRGKDEDRDDRERRRRHREEENDEDEREKLRRERREKREGKSDGRDDDDRRRRHEEKRDRRKDEDQERRRDRGDKDREDRDRRHRDKDRDKDKDRGKDRDREREKEREERRREKEQKETQKHKSSRKEEKKKEEEEEAYNYEDEEFEDYEEDFEEDDEEESTPVVQHRPAADSGPVRRRPDSEVNDVLRALDEENDRLLADSHPGRKQDTAWSPQYDRSDEDDDDLNYNEKSRRSEQARPRTAINFVSAKQRAITRKAASKTEQRAKDLLQMLELDVVKFDLLDLPPVKEYDLYIRSFGRSDTRQAYVQTNDDNIDREIQTEEIDSRQKWTQHPAEDSKGVGRGDGEKDIDEEEESQHRQKKDAELGHLSQFLQKASQVFSILMEEDRDERESGGSKHQSHIDASENFTQLDLLPVLEGRYVEFASFSPTEPSLFLTVYSKAPTIVEDNPVSKRGIICVWNSHDLSYPQKILACTSQPKCCCFSPVKPSLAFAGMVDGSVAMWDLREPMSLHRPTVVLNEEYYLRYPTYDTAGVLDNENHHSPVASLLPIYSYISSSKSGTQLTEDTSSGLSFQLVSTEDTAVLNFWVVAEIQTPDAAGSETDLGLAPGGRVKLLKSSSLTLENPNKDARIKTGLRALSTRLLPTDPNQFYVGTDSGFVLHGVRFGNRAYPRAHSTVISSIVDILSIDFSPFEQPCFLAGSSDGSFALYNTKSEHPLVVWPDITRGRPVCEVRWSPSRPCIFYVLDSASTLYIFDLLEGDALPKQTEQISKEKVVCFTMTTDHKTSGLGSPGRSPQMLFGLESGKTEIHTISKSLREPQELELEFLISYLERF